MTCKSVDSDGTCPYAACPSNSIRFSVLEALLRYLVFALLGIVGPGLGLQRLLRLRADPALVLPLGTAVSAGAYWLSLRMAAPLLFPIAVLVLDLVLLVRLPARLLGDPEERSGEPEAPLPSHPTWKGPVLAFAAIVLLLAMTQYPWNRVGREGDFLLDPLVTSDTAFHVGLTRELALGYPPQLPGVSGFPLGYHLGVDLVRAAALRWAEVDPFDSISRFDVTLWALALVLVLPAVTRRLGGTGWAATLTPWTLLATDWSFLFTGPQAHWWADTLRGNLLLSLVYANPVIPALALALGSLLALSRFEAGEGRGWLALAGIQAFAVPHFKVFLGAHLLLGLGVAFLVAPRARRGIAITALPVALATALLVLGQGGKTVSVVLDPLEMVRTTREGLGLPVLNGGSLALWALAWLLASLGLRVVGLGAALRGLRSGSSAAPALAAMALAAWPLALVFRVSAPAALPGQKVINDVNYLLEQGGPLLWLFAALAVGTWMDGGPRRAVFAIVAAAVLSLPSTLHYAIKKAFLAPDPVPAAVVRAMEALKRTGQPGEIVMQRPGARFPPAPVIFAGRRVPYERFTPYLTQFASPEDLRRRHETVYRFFQTREVEEARGIAEALGARYLCLYGPDRVRFDTTGRLEPLHEESGARLYRFRWDGPARP